MMKILALCSIPFGFTEFLFYPSYWEPKFLWNLVNKIGFGIEDILFVIGLSAFCSTSYAVFNQKFLTKIQNNHLNPKLTLTMILISLLFFIFIVTKLNLHLIYGAPLFMLIVSLYIFWQRNDLFIVGILGSIYSIVVYSSLCYILLIIYPNFFDFTWHLDKFSNIKILKIPAEELLYAGTSGCIASIFYPFVFGHKYSNTANVYT
ncbi:lycopene cyclase domain-containing protein [Leptospira sp. 96542]|nr:lycopene cyclase domain-containing protein [Leptospira sp. 96542]